MTWVIPADKSSTEIVKEALERSGYLNIEFEDAEFVETNEKYAAIFRVYFTNENTFEPDNGLVYIDHNGKGEF